MNNLRQQLVSFILPILVLVIVPYCIEKDLSVHYIPFFIIGLVIMIAGLCLLAWAVTDIIRIGKGTLAPWSPSRRLVTSGLYAYVRNPMILAVLIILIGEAVTILSLNILIWAACFFLINTIFFLVYEEPDLEKKFGDEYREYRKKVHRWVPKFTPFRPGEDTR